MTQLNIDNIINPSAVLTVWLDNIRNNDINQQHKAEVCLGPDATLQVPLWLPATNRKRKPEWLWKLTHSFHHPYRWVGLSMIGVNMALNTLRSTYILPVTKGTREKKNKQRDKGSLGGYG